MGAAADARARQIECILGQSQTLYNPEVSSSDSINNVEGGGSSRGGPPNTTAELADDGGDDAQLTKSGYLYKKSSHAVRPVWSRRFFVLHDNTLEYYTLEPKNNASTVRIDLRLCSVKRMDISERRHCFEIVSPVKAYTLQAENERELEEWMEVIQASIHQAIIHTIDSQDELKKNDRRKERTDMSAGQGQEMLSAYLPGTAMETALDEASRREIRNVPGNDRCADCGAPDPDWASLSLGIVVCIECSGIHRSLGVHKSKVRSLRLDYWEPEHVEIMKRLGNDKVALFIEGAYNDSEASFYRKPQADSLHVDKEQWIIAKYDLGKFTVDIEDEDSFDISKAIKEDDIVGCLHWLVSGNDPDTVLFEGHEARLPLHLCIAEQRWALAALFILWSADLELPDSRGRTPLHYLASQEQFSLSLLVCILRRNIDTRLEDERGRDAMAVALEHGHGDFCTLLRMFQHDQGGGNGGRTSGEKPISLTHPKRSFKRLLKLKHYPKIYRRLAHGHLPRRRRSTIGGSSSVNLIDSFEQIDLDQDKVERDKALRSRHRRSQSEHDIGQPTF